MNLEKYLGRWYEIAKTNNPWESDCSFATADYSSTLNGIRIKNICYDENNKAKRTVTGIAHVVNNSPRSDLSPLIALKVKFTNIPTEGDYLVLYTDYDKYSIVGDYERKFLWVLSRKSKIDRKDLPEIMKKIKSFGYDLDKIFSDKKYFY